MSNTQQEPAKIDPWHYYHTHWKEYIESSESRSLSLVRDNSREDIPIIDLIFKGDHIIAIDYMLEEHQTVINTDVELLHYMTIRGNLLNNSPLNKSHILKIKEQGFSISCEIAEKLTKRLVGSGGCEVNTGNQLPKVFNPLSGFDVSPSRH